MIRAVLDTNVIVAGLPAPGGVLAELIEQWMSQRFELVISDHIFKETEHAWSKRYWRSRVDPIEARQFLALLRRRAEIVPITVAVSGIATHAQDDLVIATALSGSAGTIVTGDREFLRIRTYREVEIIHPREFLTRLDEAETS